MKVLIDNGHGEFTPGKRSPDGEFCEWLFNREISHSIVAALNASGITAELLVRRRCGYRGRLLHPEEDKMSYLTMPAS